MILALLLALHAPLAWSAADPVRVPETMRDCSKTEECESVPLRCGCCQYDAVAKLYVTDYLKFANDKGCVDEPCTCLPLKLVPSCVKKQCVLVGGKTTPPKLKKKKRKKS